MHKCGHTRKRYAPRAARVCLSSLAPSPNGLENHPFTLCRNPPADSCQNWTRMRFTSLRSVTCAQSTDRQPHKRMRAHTHTCCGHERASSHACSTGGCGLDGFALGAFTKRCRHGGICAAVFVLPRDFERLVAFLVPRPPADHPQWRPAKAGRRDLDGRRKCRCQRFGRSDDCGTGGAGASTKPCAGATARVERRRRRSIEAASCLRKDKRN